jgi:hypothetical protein
VLGSLLLIPLPGTPDRSVRSAAFTASPSVGLTRQTAGDPSPRRCGGYRCARTSLRPGCPLRSTADDAIARSGGSGPWDGLRSARDRLSCRPRDRWTADRTAPGYRLATDRCAGHPAHRPAGGGWANRTSTSDSRTSWGAPAGSGALCWNGSAKRPAGTGQVTAWRRTHSCDSPTGSRSDGLFSRLDGHASAADRPLESS